MDELLAAAPLPVLVGLATFVVHLKSTWKDGSLKDAKVLTLGGSYPGNL